MRKKERRGKKKKTARAVANCCDEIWLEGRHQEEGEGFGLLLVAVAYQC